MNQSELKEAALLANLAIVQHGLVVMTWGNASVVDRKTGLIAIKPSGVAYDALRVEHIVLVSLEDGRIIDSRLRPSSDTPTHLHLYQHIASIGSIVHTHSTHATAWAQLNRPLPCYGTTHADHFHGAVPVARPLNPREIEDQYERAAGISIVETFDTLKINPEHVPAVLLPGHAPFTWGPDAPSAIQNAIALEESARMAFLMGAAQAARPELDSALVNKHFERKHGPRSYYGQATEKKGK